MKFNPNNQRGVQMVTFYSGNARLYVDDRDDSEAAFKGKYAAYYETPDHREEFREVPPSDDKQLVYKSLCEFARAEGWQNQIVENIKSGKRVLQSSAIMVKDTSKLSDDERIKLMDEYFDKKRSVENLEAKLMIEQKRLKEEISDEIESLVEEMAEHEQVIRSGYQYLNCEASWERDIDSGMMLLIRHDTLEVINVRPMTLHEAQGDLILDSESEEGNNGEAEPQKQGLAGDDEAGYMSGLSGIDDEGLDEEADMSEEEQACI
jgi:hypothetical protein